MSELRFGILCEGTVFPEWQARCLRELLAVEGVSAELLVLNAEPPVEYSGRERLLRLLRGEVTLHRLYERVFGRRSVAMQPVDLSEELSGVPQIEVRVERKGKFSEYFRSEDLEKIEAHQLDFMLRFSFGIIRGKILEATRFGVWSFHHDDPDRYRGTPPGFWEIFHDDPVTGAILQRLTSRLDGGVILHRGWFKTLERSWLENRDAAFLGAAAWPSRVCRQILAGDTHAFEQPPTPTEAPIFYKPTNLEMLRYLGKRLRNTLRVQYGSLFRSEQWNIGIAERTLGNFLEGGEPGTVNWAPQPDRTRFLADPFAAPGDEQTILVEEFDYLEGRGKISALRHDGEKFEEPRTVIERSEHQSYPYLIRHDGEIYCVPECHESREVCLYRALDFPSRWERHATILEGFAAVDPTLFQHEQRWWLLCTDGATGADTQLSAWYAPHLDGPWEPHALNPVKTDIRSSRPAGPPFAVDGQLYRPAQDGSNGYGSAITLNRVDRLTPTEFREETVAQLCPDPDGPYPDGIHTLTSLGDRAVIDGRRNVFIPSVFRRNLAAKLRRALRLGRA